MSWMTGTTNGARDADASRALLGMFFYYFFINLLTIFYR